MLNGSFLYPWQLKVLKHLYDTGLSSCKLIIIKKDSLSQPPSIISRFSRFSLFEVFKRTFLHQHIFRQVPIPDWINAKVIEVETNREGKFGESLSEEDIREIKGLQLDFLLRFGFGILKGDVLSCTKWGIWSFHHGNEQEFRGGPAGYWEIIKNAATQGVILQQLTEKLDAGNLILKREYSVIRHSYRENLQKLLWHSADMPAQALQLLSNGNISPDSFNTIQTTAPIYKYPTNLSFIFGLCVLLINRVKLKYTLLFKQEKWVIGYKPVTDVQYKFISSQATGSYYADPFIVEDTTGPKILAEYYCYKKKRGSIVLLNPHLKDHKIILDKETHLSYPFVYKEGDEVFIIPEEGNTGGVHLYKWNKYHETVEFVSTLLHLPGIDTSLVKLKNTYYLFTGIQGDLPNEKLFIYYADKLEGPYIPHPCNPVKVSPIGTRMAGSFYDENNILIRPSQSSIRIYGEKVIFNRIKELTKTAYEEEILNELTPGMLKGFEDGLHTYHKSGNFVVIDVKRMRSDWISFKSQLK